MNLGPESAKSYERRKGTQTEQWLIGDGIDIGYKGSENCDPYPGSKGIDLDTEGYDGVSLPLPTGSLDFVHSSHCLEHIPSDNLSNSIREWLRVLKIGGRIVCTVPHMFLYEKKATVPSNWNGDHKRFYTPGRLASEFEASLPPNSYRIVSLMDCDKGYTYDIPPENHAGGNYEIEIIVQKIKRPIWNIL